ncbi:MAG: DnaD domain protein [Acidaminococcus sp.]|uniref:DnaD domain protein n=1 Tax=Acidaminococcus sp. TaxID=1872103 RepID=UPI002A766870|nr:DnaD domain protein [Acidaminococcus sp.]MDY2739550.1 DnaD domain protein [Acidaminococcus sp.]
MSKGRLTINYIDQINAFHNWLQVNELPASAILLWYSLMHFCNKTGWKLQFNLALSQLKADTHLGTSTIQRARERLVKAGLIKIRHRSGCQSAIYQIVPVASIFVNQNEQQNNFAVQNEQLNEQQAIQNGQQAVQNEQLNGHIPRPRLIKTIKDAGSTTGKKMVVSYYQNKIHPLHNTTELELLEALVDDYGQERVEQAIDRAVLRGKRTINYINGILKRWETDGYDEAEAISDDAPQIPAEFRNVTF